MITINLGGRRRHDPARAAARRSPSRALFAAVLGYFMIYGRVSGVFFGIVTFATTLVLAAFMAQTAGPEWAIGRPASTASTA